MVSIRLFFFFFLSQIHEKLHLIGEFSFSVMLRLIPVFLARSFGGREGELNFNCHVFFPKTPSLPLLGDTYYG